jgi:tetratricopeptide (TPR) repeat protein
MRFATTIIVLTISVGSSVSAFAQMGGYGGYGGSSGSLGQTAPMQRDDYQIAVREIREQKYDDAIPHLERAAEKQPHNADIMNLLATTYRITGNYPLAMAWYKKALAENPDHKRAHENLGELYLGLNDLPSAQAQLAELARLCPDGCDDRDALGKAVAAYQAQPAATPASAPAAQPTTPGSH